MIRKTKKGYSVCSGGRGGVYKTKKKALKRLRQIEFYKNNGKKKKKIMLRLKLNLLKNLA